MSERRRALGRGLGALIPSGPGAGGATGRPVDVFFPDQRGRGDGDAGGEEAGDSEQTDQASGVRGQDSAGPTVGADPSTIDAVEDTATALNRPAPVRDDPPNDGTTSGRSGQRSSVEHDGSEAGSDRHSSGTARSTTETQQRSPSGGDTGSGSTDLVAVPGATFAEIALDAIQPNAHQPRQVFDEEELEELASSIREVGVLQPIVVRAAGTGPEGEARYELIMGERRWRASELAGQSTVPAIIRDTAESDMLRDALLENLHRAQLNPLEEAAAYQQLLDDFDCTHDELASRIARSRPQISNTLRLLKLPPLVQRRVAAGVLSAGHARALLGLSDGAAMERVAQRIVAEGLSVRATEELVTLGEEPMQPEMRRRPRAGAHNPALNDLASRLSDQFDTKVKVNLGQRKGRINIEFASVQDLNRILGVLAPQDPGVFQSATSLADGEAAPGFSPER